MKKFLSILLLAVPALSVAAQDLPASKGSYLNHKSLTVGYGLIGLDMRGLNDALKDAGYPLLPASTGIASIAVSTDFGPRWGVFYATDFSTSKSESRGLKSSRFQFTRLYGGVEFFAFRHQGFEVLGRVAASYSIATVRLYDTLTDTSSFAHYLSGTADAKRFTAGKLGLDAGFQTRFRILENVFMGIGAGYVLTSGSSDWKHDAGHLGDAPAIGLGSCYIGVRIGVLFNRRIMRITPAMFEKNEPEEGKSKLYVWGG